MKLSRQREFLAWLWGASFTLAMLGYLYLRCVVRIDSDVSSQLLNSITGQYLPLVGAILGFYYAGRKSTQAAKKGQAIPFYLAIGMSALWNLFALVFVLHACWDPNMSPDAVKGLSTDTPKLSWLVAGAMIFFFGTSPEAQK
ncbi:MAG: hypothetical protein ACLQVL_03900 [Terriglobia bacterium]